MTDHELLQAIYFLGLIAFFWWALSPAKKDK
jgi:hypothetical protein